MIKKNSVLHLNLNTDESNTDVNAITNSSKRGLFGLYISSIDLQLYRKSPYSYESYVSDDNKLVWY